MSSKKVGKPEPERLKKAHTLEENVEVIKLIERAGHVKDVSLARHVSSSITHRNCPTCEKTNKQTKRAHSGDFPGGTVDKTPSSQCRGPGFDL